VFFPPHQQRLSRVNPAERITTILSDALMGRNVHVPDSFAEPAIQRFLASKDVVILATLQKHGTPLAMPMWFVADTAGLAMVSVANSQKVRNLRRDGRVCVVAESGNRGVGICGMSVQGQVVFLEHAEAYQPVVTRLLQKYEPHLARLWGGTTMPPDRVVFRIVPEKVYHWGLD
jgi:nitroimidazol reductase NimA-like FMN-containing flavoprotein (pyridoxamine 5'-phosphate oxidase superfamily)